MTHSASQLPRPRVADPEKGFLLVLPEYYVPPPGGEAIFSGSFKALETGWLGLQFLRNRLAS